MERYRKQYLCEDSHREEWVASPCFAPREALEKLPQTFIAIAGCDLLAPEERAFASVLEGLGVQVERREYEGGTHIILDLAG